MSLKSLVGYRVIVSNNIIKSVQSKTHKKKRINKKWLKQYGYKTVPDDDKIFVTDGYIFATQRGIKRLLRAMDRE